MRIGIDGYNLALPRGTGVAAYAARLVGALRDMGHGTDGVFGIDVPRDAGLRQAAFFDRYRRQAAPERDQRPWRRIWRKTWRYPRAFTPHALREVTLDAAVAGTIDGPGLLPPFDRLFSAARLFEDSMFAFARTGRFATIRLSSPPTVMHWTYPVPIRLAGARNIYTLHDLVPLRLPHATLDNKEVYARLIAGCLRHGAQICTVSEASRRDIVDLFAVDPLRITNTYQVAGLTLSAPAADPVRDAAAVESLYGLKSRDYFLYFGAIEPKKNVGRLIEAYLTLRTATPLVIAGGNGWQSAPELQLLPGEGAQGKAGSFRGPCDQTIVRLDYLPRDQLAMLVRGAKAVVFPSLYEGFGLPVLEAMRLGTPVITSTTSSLPEVAGDAALLIDPYDIGALADAMRRVDHDETLCRGMSARGLRQAKLFSNERYQERLAQLYKAALRY